MLFNDSSLPLPFLTSSFFIHDFATRWNPALYGKILPNFCSAYVHLSKKLNMIWAF